VDASFSEGGLGEGERDQRFQEGVNHHLFVGRVIFPLPCRTKGDGTTTVPSQKISLPLKGRLFSTREKETTPPFFRSKEALPDADH